MAKQAVAIILSVVSEIDTELKLVFVPSGKDNDYQGCASVWEFFFDLPRRQASAALTVEPYPTALKALCVVFIGG